jgi:serine/threonine-protein kinase
MPLGGAESIPASVPHDTITNPTHVTPNGTLETSGLDATVAPGLETSTTSSSVAALVASSSTRYVLAGELGRGQQGVVMSARDTVLGRNVALKIVHADTDPEATRLFVREARTMACITHPNVVPVYDAGVLPDGRAFYAMPVLPKRTLRDVLDERNEGQGDSEHALVRLLRSFSSVCMGIEAAHAAGILHRDLKPANLVYGTRGEIMVGDFGLAKFVDGSLVTKSPGGTTIGTPLYMSPEQARGDPNLETSTDVYALGVILYEILTGGLPIVRNTIFEQVMALIDAPPDPPLPRLPHLVVPPDLAALAMRCLVKDATARPSSARVLVDEVDAWLEGRYERQRRAAEVERLLTQARASLAESASGRAVVLADRRELLGQLASLPEHASIERKVPVWHAFDAVEARARELRRADDDAMVLLESALRVDPESGAARSLLAQIHLSRMARAEERRDREGAAEAARRARAVDPIAAARVLDQPSTLRVVLAKSGSYDLDVFEERDRLLVPIPVRRRIPSGERVSVAPGSYLARAWSEHGIEVVLPMRVRRGDALDLVLDAAPADRAPRGFVYVPAGPAVLGGDAESPFSEPEREKRVEGFCVMRDPVSCAEYALFLEAIYARDPREAVARMPRVANDAAPYWRIEAGRVVLPSKDEQGDEWRPDFPVLSVSALDAEAYAAWRGAMEGCPYTLPTDEQWERAGRGADGRAYPWGHHFDPALCKMRLSRPGDPAPEPIGSFKTDVSIFGVRDLAGGIAEWTSSPYREDIVQRSVRGGSWGTRAHRCALTFRGIATGDTPSSDLGFRLVSPT